MEEQAEAVIPAHIFGPFQKGVYGASSAQCGGSRR
jgi:hypothetical protein